MTQLFNTGVGYSAINTAKSALSALIVLSDSRSPGQHSLVTRYMKGVFESRPSLPRYGTTWDVSLALNWLITMDYKTINLKQLTLKVTLLLSLLTGQRLQTLRCIELQHIDFTNNSCVIHTLKVLKTTKPGKHIPPIVLNLYDIENLCILRHLSRYRELTTSLRSHPDGGSLLISFKKPHSPVVEDTLSRRIKTS